MSKICQSNRQNTVELINMHTHTYILFSTRRWVSSFSKDVYIIFHKKMGVIVFKRIIKKDPVDMGTLNIVG